MEICYLKKRFSILVSKTITLSLIILFCSSVLLNAQSETHIKYLSGTGKDDTVDWDFFCSEGRESGEWTKIAVPSCWELEGFGNYNYGHDVRNNKPIHDEYGMYKHEFVLPSDWKNKEVKIVFEGVMTDCEVKINGELAGEIHQGAFSEFTMYCHSDLTFLRMLTPEQPLDPHRGASVTDFPEGDISFVKNIPPIGTKFKTPDLMGPKGVKKRYFSNSDEPVRIDLSFEF